MARQPLIVFPTPEPAERSKLPNRPGGEVKRPTHDRQGRRLTPMFRQLKQSFEFRRVEVQRSVAGADPDQVLVIETIGSVENFANAVKKIEGLEWMGEVELDEIEPDRDFYDESHLEKPLSGRLYLVMSNQRALDELLSLWRSYQRDPNLQWQRGFTRFRDVFNTLKTLRRWSVEDRLLETGILDVWREELQHDGDRLIGFEAELWFRTSEEIRQESANLVGRLIEEQGGRVVAQSTIPEISYHAILGEIPRNVVETLIREPNIELVKSDNIMFFRPVGQMTSKDRGVEGEVSTTTIGPAGTPTGEPVIAVFDGLPLENHQLLAGRLIVDDPDGWAAQYPARERRHGTAMASLVTRGDLNNNETPLPSPVYIRPVMRPDNRAFINPRPESMPRDELPVDLLHRAVRRLFESVGGDDPVAPNVKIINISIGDPSQQFNRLMSPLGRLLDWLSVRYGVVFIVSSGNFPGNIETGIDETTFDSMNAADKEKAVVHSILSNGRIRRLLAPGESINALTVGASHFDYCAGGGYGNRIDLYTRELPSPISTLGSGYRRSVKPDIVFEGGKQLYRKSVGTGNLELELVNSVLPPGNKAAAPGTTGQTNAVAHYCGTSNATSLVSRNAEVILRELRATFVAQAPDWEYEEFLAPLLKAALVHGATWGDIGKHIESLIQQGRDAREVKSLLARWLGYGKPDFTRARFSTDQRAVVLGFGELNDEEGHVFELPLPPSLSSQREWRRLIVTLAYMSPLAPKTQKYRVGSLWFEASTDDLGLSRTAADWQAVRRGTVQHEIFEGDNAVPITDGDTLTIKVNCRNEASRLVEPVRYGLIVTLEVAEGVDIAIYNEIRTRIVVPIQVQPGEGDTGV